MAIIENNGLSCSHNIPRRKPLYLDEMTQEQLDEELRKGFESGEPISTEELRRRLKEEIGL